MNRFLSRVFSSLLLLFLLSLSVFAQETTGGLQGTVKDANGAVVPKATVELTGNKLAGSKIQQTDNSGYYRFANLPPGSYAISVKAPGFSSLKREGINLDVGHLPTLDLSLAVGSASTVVEVTAEAPLIDVTTNSSSTNVTPSVISDIPHGRTFQSVIQFAPSARNEPLQGAMGASGQPNGGTGGSLPGSTGNGLAYGFSVAGGADSENSYLVEGQDTENISGGYSSANVPFEFIQEVQVKSSGIEAEHGGAIGGVINVIMKKGSNDWHGELFTEYESNPMDGSPTAYLRYDPTSSGCPGTSPAPPSCPVGAPTGFRTDAASQLVQPRQDHFRIIQPGATIGGPIIRDRVWFFAGIAPLFTDRVRTVDFGAVGSGTPAAGVQEFNQDQQAYIGTARIDATVTQKIRVFASYLSQHTRESGVNLPVADSVQGFLNESTTVPITAFSHGFGYSAPNLTTNIGADITLTPRLVSTTRYGYFFQNYHDFGWPTAGANLQWSTNGVGQTDNLGGPLPGDLQETIGTQTAFAYKQQFTKLNANKHYQFDEDVAFFKSGWWGTHNFKVGYQLNHLALNISQNGNVPQVFVFAGAGQYYSPFTTFGAGNCATLSALYGGCAGQYGYLNFNDFATIGSATDTNHGLFFQDSWTMGRGLTINAGLRIEKETLPPPPGQGLLAGHTINFGWGDKVAPRLGAAWDVLRNGKMKVFGSYGVTNDIMKLLLAETSWGGQAFEECIYAMSSPITTAAINPVFVNGRACPNGGPNVGVNFAGGTTPAGLSLIENSNLRPFEPVAPGVKPYRQHESVFGVDYALSKNWAFEARWDRRRLDHILEDASLSDTTYGELYSIVNPGEGVNKTLDGYSAYLGSLGQVFGSPGFHFDSAAFGLCPTCPNNPKAIRNYDGIELRLTKAVSRHFSGMFSYTYSSLRGNYTGLTTSEQTDGNEPGRNSPDTSRSFDEPYFYFNAAGKSSSGPLPTDRPNTFKGYIYYQLPLGKRNTTTFGLFQTAYEGATVSSFIDVGGSLPGQPSYAVYPFNRGKFVDATTDALGNITLGPPHVYRTPWYNQTDFNFMHEVKVNRDNERRVIGFEATISNLLNQHTVTSRYGGINSFLSGTALYPNGVQLAGAGAAAYQTFESGYNVQSYINQIQTIAGNTQPAVALSSWYGQPYTYQQARTIRLKLRYTF